MSETHYWSVFMAKAIDEWLCADLKEALFDAPKTMPEQAASQMEVMVNNWLLNNQLLENPIAALNVVTVLGALVQRTQRLHLLRILTAFKSYPAAQVAQRAAMVMSNLPLTADQLSESIRVSFDTALRSYRLAGMLPSGGQQ